MRIEEKPNNDERRGPRAASIDKRQPKKRERKTERETSKASSATNQTVRYAVKVLRKKKMEKKILRIFKVFKINAKYKIYL